MHLIPKSIRLSSRGEQRRRVSSCDTALVETSEVWRFGPGIDPATGEPAPGTDGIRRVYYNFKIIIIKMLISNVLSCRDMDSRKVVAVLFLFALCGVSFASAAQITTVAAGNQTIVQLAQAHPELSTLVTAVQAAGLVETLSSSGPFTVFAPTNDAFKALPPGTLDALLGNKSELTNVLTYHVVPGSLVATQVASRPSLTTIQGQALAVTVQSSGGVRVNGATIVQTDIPASNGVIHVIDAVLIPTAATPSPTPVVTVTLTPTPTPTPSGFDAVLVSVCALTGIALLIGARRRY